MANGAANLQVQERNNHSPLISSFVGANDIPPVFESGETPIVLNDGRLTSAPHSAVSILTSSHGGLMKIPFGNNKHHRTPRASLGSILSMAASTVLLVSGLILATTNSASAAPISPRVTSTAPCNVRVTGGGEALATGSGTIILGVVAGTSQIAIDCNTSSGAALAVEASLLSSIGSSNVIPNGEVDTSALAPFAAAATDTGCPASTAGSCETTTFAVPATYSAADPNATCPPSAAQINDGVFGCAIAVVNAQQTPVAGAEYMLQYASQTTAPNPPTIAALQSKGSAGSQINVSDAAGATGSWWGNANQVVQALATGTAVALPPSTCGTGGGYGNVPSPFLNVLWYAAGSTTPIQGSAAGVTISNNCYTGSTLNGPVLGGTIPVPATVVAGTTYAVFLCEVNVTPYPTNDAAGHCGPNPTGASWIDASFNFTAATGVISQNLPVANSATAGTSASFTDQLTASGNAGTVTYTQSAGTPQLVVSSTGAVTTSGALAAGTYTASGTTSDGTNTGTFSYSLTVTGTVVVARPAPRAISCTGVALPGRTVTMSINGRNFTARPKITGRAGTTVTVTRTSGSRLTIKVRTAASVKKGTYVFTIRFASGKRTSVHYRVK